MHGPYNEHQTAMEYSLTNPLSAGELAFVVGAAGVGWVLADLLGRYLNTTAVVVTAGTPATINGIPIGAMVSNDVATLTMPGWKSMAGQAGLALVLGVAAAKTSPVAHPGARAALQGAMIGTGLRLFTGIVTPVLANLFKNSALGQRLYLAEIEAREAGALTAAQAGSVGAATGPGTFAQGATTVLGSTAAGGTGTLSGLPRHDPGPVARLTQGMGQPQTPNQKFQNLQPAPGFQPTPPVMVYGNTVMTPPMNMGTPMPGCSPPAPPGYVQQPGGCGPCNDPCQPPPAGGSPCGPPATFQPPPPPPYQPPVVTGITQGITGLGLLPPTALFPD